jgi:polyisoprenyl-phosphate glycosyltransferase
VAVATRPEYSLALPIYNEEETIPELVRRLGQLMDQFDGDATDGIVSFSAYPLRLALKVGFLVSAFSFVLGSVFLVSRLAGLYSVPGLASIAVFVAFLGGIQLLLLGIMGEYIARIHDEVKGRPLYLVSEARGLEEPGVR